MDWGYKKNFKKQLEKLHSRDRVDIIFATKLSGVAEQGCLGGREI